MREKWPLQVATFCPSSIMTIIVGASLLGDLRNSKDQGCLVEYFVRSAGILNFNIKGAQAKTSKINGGVVEN